MSAGKVKTNPYSQFSALILPLSHPLLDFFYSLFLYPTLTLSVPWLEASVSVSVSSFYVLLFKSPKFFSLSPLLSHLQTRRSCCGHQLTFVAPLPPGPGTQGLRSRSVKEGTTER